MTVIEKKIKFLEDRITSRDFDGDVQEAMSELRRLSSLLVAARKESGRYPVFPSAMRRKEAAAEESA